MGSTSFVFLLCALPMLGWADNQTRIGAPVSTVLFDAQSRSIRPLIGYPGASYLGDALVTDVDAAAVSPDTSSALFVRQGQLYLVTGLKNGTPGVAAVEGALANVDRFAWSIDGTAAAIYASGSGSAQILRDPTVRPAPTVVMDLSALRGTLSALAVDRTGTYLLAGFAAKEGGGVYVTTPGADARMLAGAVKPVTIVLANQDHDLYFADQARQQIWQVATFDQQPTPLLFADAGSGLSSPAGIGLSADAKRMYVAEAGSQSLDVFDMDARVAAERIDLEFIPETLSALGGRSLMLLKNSTQAEDPYFILNDAAGDGLAVFFVPSGRQP